MNVPFKTDLKGKTAVVTGAGGVICGAFSKALALSGARVALVNRSKGAAETVCGEIESAGGTAKVYVCDVLDKQALIRTREQIRADFGKCDILINGAGGNADPANTAHEFYQPCETDEQSFFDIPESAIHQVFGINFTGTLFASQVFLADMTGRTGCCVINITSLNAFKPFTKIPAYSAAKAAVANFTEWLAVHFAKEGVRVNAIAPGVFLSRQNESLLFDKSGRPTARTQKILNHTPMGRLGQTEELIGAMLFLADTNASSFITGTVITVDGGFTAYSGV